MFAPPIAESKTKAVSRLAHETGRRPANAESSKLSEEETLAIPAQAEAARRPLPWNFSTIPVFPALQRKLIVGSVNDPLEREADHAADLVMQTGFAQVQRKCASCENGGDDSGHEEDRKVHLKPSDAGQRIPGGAPAPPAVAAALARPGLSLEPASRSFFEPRFGRSLGDVRIHSDADAGRSAQAVAARAYTVGSDVVFAPGQYSPGTAQGRWLLAHELAHVQQQNGSRYGSRGEPTVVRRQPADGEMVAKTPAPAAGATAPQTAPPATRDLGLQDPAEGKLVPLERPADRRVQLMTFDCDQMLLAIDAGSVRVSYKLETCSMPPGSYEPVINHEPTPGSKGRDFSLDFGHAADKGEAFRFRYLLGPGQINPARLLAGQDKVFVEVAPLATPSGKDPKAKQPSTGVEQEAQPVPAPCVIHLQDRPLVAPDSASRALFKPLKLDQTVWSEPIPLGEFGFVEVDANVSGGLSGTLSGQYGPGDLTDICLTHQIDASAGSAPIKHPMLGPNSQADVTSYVVGGRARFTLPASARVVILGNAKLVIAADYLSTIRVGSIEGGFDARGEAALGGKLDAMVDVIARFTRSSARLQAPIGDLSVEISHSSLDKIDLAAQVALQGHASLSFGLNAFTAVKFLGFELWRENWKLNKAAKLGLGWEGGIKYSPNPGIHWILGAIDMLEGIDDELFDDEESHVDTDDVLGSLLSRSNGTQITPDGLSKKTALPFTWHKPLDFYPKTLAIPNAGEPKELDRDNGPTSVRRTVGGKSVYERIGVIPENWVGAGRYLQYVPHAAASRAQQNRLRNLLVNLGFDNSGTEIDHVRDLHLGGNDTFNNLWPLDQATNSAAGPLHEGQIDHYRQQFAAQNQTLEGRIFVISDVHL